MSSNLCVTGTASSNIISVDLLPISANSVTISSDITGKYIVSGQAVTFTASVPDSANVSYNWLLNGKSTGARGAVFNTSMLKSGDVVSCQAVKSGACVTPKTATSNTITVLIGKLLAYPKSLIQVYNRYGALVYQSQGYTAGWDGRAGGKPLPIGTYYYVIDLRNGKPPRSGTITILR